MSLIVTATASRRVPHGSGGATGESSGSDFADVMAGMPPPENTDVRPDTARTSPALGKPHPAAKMHKLRSDADRSTSDGGPSRDDSVIGVAPQAHSHSSDSATALAGAQKIKVPVGTVSTAAAAANGGSTAVSNSSGPSAAALSSTGSYETVASGAASGPGQSRAGMPTPAVPTPAVPTPAVLTAGSGTSGSGTFPVAKGFTAQPHTAKAQPTKGTTASGQPANRQLGGAGSTESMLTSLPDLGADVPATGTPVQPAGNDDGGKAVGTSTAVTSHITNSHIPAARTATTDAPMVQELPGQAVPAQVSAAYPAGQLAQPVPFSGLQSAAGQPSTMTSTPAQVWTAAEPLGPQLTSSVLPLRAGGDGSHQLIIALHPEQLGPVNVHVRILGDAMTIQLASGTQDAHETLRAALPELRHELQAAGLGSVDLSLDGGTSNFSGFGSQREPSRHGSHPAATPLAERAPSVTRPTIRRTAGVPDSGLDRWL